MADVEAQLAAAGWDACSLAALLASEPLEPDCAPAPLPAARAANPPAAPPPAAAPTIMDRARAACEVNVGGRVMPLTSIINQPRPLPASSNEARTRADKPDHPPRTAAAQVEVTVQCTAENTIEISFSFSNTIVEAIKAIAASTGKKRDLHWNRNKSCWVLPKKCLQETL